MRKIDNGSGGSSDIGVSAVSDHRVVGAVVKPDDAEADAGEGICSAAGVADEGFQHVPRHIERRLRDGGADAHIDGLTRWRAGGRTAVYAIDATQHHGIAGHPRVTGGAS